MTEPPRSTSFHLPAALVALVCLALVPAAGESAQVPTPADPAPQIEALERAATIGLDEIERGQTGYGYTVFAGSEPERFEVEVIGVLRNTDPGTSYVLTKISGHGLEKSGVASGMSGSPIYIDGRLMGALAFSWPYAQEAIAGITPIAAMRSIGELPSGLTLPPPRIPAGPSAGGGGAFGAPESVTVAGVEITPAMLASGDVPADLADRALATLAPRFAASAPGVRSSVGWAVSGFGEGALGRLDAALGATAPVGTAASAELPELVPGGPVAAVLVDGDLRLAASGTVTELFGDEVLAFGHSFLGMGPVSVPMATSEVVTIVASDYSSFKVSNLGQVIGAFEQDQLTGIRGQIGLEAPMIPLELSIGGLRDRTYSMRLAAVPQLLPSLVAAATIGSLESASYASGPQGIDLEARFALEGFDDLVVRQTFDGVQAGQQASSYLVSLAGYLAANDLERVKIERIDVVVEQTALPRSATLVAAHAERTLVRPGETVRLHLRLRSFGGETFRRTVEVPVAEDLPAGRLSLLVGDGASADAARLQLVPTEPVSFPQALEQLRSYHAKDQLLVLQVFREEGLATGGESLPRLPGSIRSIWKASASGGAQEIRLAVVDSVVETLPYPVEGLVRVDLEVERRRPVGGSADGGEVGGGDAPAADGAPEASGTSSELSGTEASEASGTTAEPRETGVSEVYDTSPGSAPEASGTSRERVNSVADGTDRKESAS